MVSFNPYTRPTVEEALGHPFFEKIRRSVFESQARHVIELQEIDGEVPVPNMTVLKKLVLQEVKYFKDKRAREGPEHILKPSCKPSDKHNHHS